MLDPDLSLKVLKRVLSHGGEYADIFVEQRRTSSIHLEDEKVEKVSTGVDSGVGIRLIRGGKTSYAFSNDTSEVSFAELAETLSKTVKGSFKPLFDLRKARPGTDFVIQKFPDTIPIAAKIDLVHKTNRAARSSDGRIKQVSVNYRDFIQRVCIATSEGIIAEDERVHTLAMVHVIAAENGIIQTGYETAGGHIGFELFDGVSVEELSLRASRRAVMMLRARRAPGGRMPVVISSDAGGTMVHEAIGHGLEADLAQYGLSVYSHQLGHQVASRLVTVIDDATLPHKRGSYRFDDEGTPSQRTVLVDRGILSGYMYDKFTAARDGVTSTGNGRRESYRHRPLPRMSNTFIAPGHATSDEVVKSTPEGLFVKKMGGGQVNTVTGDFVFEVQEGYMIENGNIGEPVREATLTGSGPDVLSAIDLIASDLGFSIGTCGKDAQGVPVSDAMPTIRIREMVVGGEVPA
ncbi:MAG: TldD/PmbA family protein [Nitrospirae bacterium]|nr:TldD/PmbA family protein [Nitrospirota bacterium]MCL5421525.1 TldD/PmbA family protein [Nitrospirota bacterium]